MRGTIPIPKTARIEAQWKREFFCQSWRLKLSRNRKVGRAVLCAPTAATTIPCPTQDGARGVTRPTSVHWFMVPMHPLLEAEALHELSNLPPGFGVR
jgi:hypothetical protein